MPDSTPVRGRRGLRALVASSYISSLGDGAFLAAMPLAAAAITRDPAAVAIVAAAEYLPWLAITPVSGALVDRWNRRTVLVSADVLRACALVALTAVIVLGATSIPLLAATAFAVVVGQIFADTASQTVVVDLAGRDETALHKANGHISAAGTTGKSLVGPPIGSVLFAAAPWLPFVLDAASFAGSAGLARTLPVDLAEPAESGRPRLFASIATGVKFLAQHRTLRTLCLLVAAANLANFMALATFVLYATSRLGVSTAMYGVLLAAGALGGIAGGMLTARIVTRLGNRGAIIAGLVAGTIAWPGLAITSSAYVAAAMLMALEFAAAVTTVVAITARQQVTPPELLGRVISAFRTVGAGAAPLGALAGGLLAATIDLSAPLYAAGAVLGVAVLISARLGDIDAKLAT